MPLSRPHTHTYAELKQLIDNAGGTIFGPRTQVNAARTAHAMRLISRRALNRVLKSDIQSDPMWPPQMVDFWGDEHAPLDGQDL